MIFCYAMLLFKLGYMDTVSTLDLLHYIYIYISIPGLVDNDKGSSCIYKHAQ